MVRSSKCVLICQRKTQENFFRSSWDRQPFLSTIRDDLPSFVPLRRTIKFNLIFANYGSSQGVDNDDGSSWYHLHHNLFYDADGFVSTTIGKPPA